MDNKDRSIIPSQGGAFSDIMLRLKLIARLMSDNRVNGLLKLLPIGALIYLISPIDLVSGLAFPLVGALDDAAIMWLASYVFLEFVPTDVLKEHLKKLIGNNAIIDQVSAAGKEDGEIIDAESKEIKD